MKTFWDIEQEKTWHIYALLGVLLIFYFVPIFFIWVVIKIIIHARLSLDHPGVVFRLFDFDTIFVLALAAIASSVHWYCSNKTVVRRVLRLLNAKPPDKNDKYHYVFQNIVDEIETSAGGIAIERYVVPTSAMNAFALADFEGRKAIGVTEGLLSRLNRDEIQAVVAHETAHIVSNDCLQTTIICSLFSIYSEALAQFNRTIVYAEPRPSLFFGETQQHSMAAVGVFAIPVVVLLFLIDLAGQFLNMFISREKECRADASAVKLTRNPLSLASALYKIGTHWRGAGFGGEYLSPIFILSPDYNSLDEQEGVIATLFSTHPPLKKRLQTILQLGHAGLNDIRDQIKQRRGPKIEEEKTEFALKFLVERDGKWKGPYTLLQMQALDWFQPDTDIRMPDSGEILKAGEIPALSFFFERRNEPIAKMHRLCPDCREWLVLQEYEGLYIWRCAYCHGVLVEGDKLPRIFVRKEKGFSERITRLAELLRAHARSQRQHLKMRFDTPHPRSCPKCGKAMMRRFYSYAYHVEIDVCSACNLSWFDVDELEILQCLIELEETNP